ncbi:taurine ABC transporter substrate-binding protein [Aureimonas frigidaquae]|uniref:Taurine ABC transporter, periplasmic taurine-binding protein n=1 Tax=Aureimonas frigidaquae TaxID=424757 RepID=A0A0P0Z4X3_9HYPH|nr:ABC transporter substrate-binding protein [Aureimonas frigidaquae]BAT29006.1 taurine ABC transporter, periplasmic taurine-binding protein [Aureimonas frigidaquae]
MRSGLKLALLAGAMTLSAHPALAIDKVTVAYFLEWPTANQAAQADKAFEEALGVPVEWRAFGNGNEMTQAMVSGDVQIAYSQGFIPFIVGVTNGAPLELVGVAVTYAENDLCIVRDDAGITKENAKELEGKRVATPIGNVTHYKLLRSLEVLGVDATKVELVQMNPADAAVALMRGDVPMACAFGGPLDRMREVGKPLMTGAEQEAAGINTFDIVSVEKSFADENPEMVKAFMRVTAEANAAYEKSPDAKIDVIANAAGMDTKAAADMLSLFGFPTVEEQLGPNWLGGGIQQAAKGVADLMKSSGNIDRTLDDYGPFVTTQYLTK